MTAVAVDARRDGAAIVAGVVIAGALAAALRLDLLVFEAVVGAVALAGLVVLFRRRPHVLAVVVVAGFPLSAALKFYVSPLFGPAKDAVVVAGGAALVWELVSRRRSATPRREVDAWLVATVVVLMAVYVINPAGGHASNWANGTRLLVESMLLFLVGYLLPRDQTKVWRWTIVSLIAIGCVESVLGGAQQLIGTSRLVTQFGYEFGAQVRTTAGGQLRSFGTFDDPFNFATLVLIAAAAAAAYVRPWRWAVAITALLAFGVVCSFDRTDIALLLVVVVVLFSRRGQGIPASLFAAGLVIGGLAYFAVTKSTGGTGHHESFLLSLNGRTSTWGAVLDKPQSYLGGRGVGTIGSGLSRSKSGAIVAVGHFTPGAPPPVATNATLAFLDSTYLATVADVGIPGLLLVLVFLTRLGTAIRRASRQAPAAALTAALITLMAVLDAVTRSSLTAYPFGFVALFAIGSSLGAAERRSEPTIAHADASS